MRLEFTKGKQRELLLEVKNIHDFTQEEFARCIGVPRRTLRNWLKETRFLPESVFNQLVKTSATAEKYTSHIKHFLPDNWGTRKGGVARLKQIIHKDGDTITHMKKMHQRRSESCNPNYVKLPFEKKPMIKYDNPLPLLAVMLLTDGYHKPAKYICYCSKDEALIDVFYELANKCNCQSTKAYKRRDGRIEVFAYGIPDRTILSLSPSYKTSPSRGQAVRNYLKQPQPTAEFLMQYNKNTMLQAVRLAMSADGYVSAGKHGEDVVLGLSCAHPHLTREWEHIFHLLNLKANIHSKKSTWSGIGGLRTKNKAVLTRFRDHGGFLDGVKISRKSPNHSGLEKNHVLKWASQTPAKTGP